MQTKRHVARLILASLCTGFLATAGSAPGRTIYVHDNTSGVQDGSSWARAMPCLRDALALAAAGDEIRVAQGTYYPDQGTGAQEGDRLCSFSLPPGVLLKGGFAGPGTADPNQCDPNVFASILSGDLARNDPPALLPTERPRYADNSCRVLTVEAGDANTVLDGLTICGAGYNPGDTYSSGLWIEKGSPRILNCSFVRNSSVGLWAAGGAPFVRDCLFHNNSAGLFVRHEAVATVQQCRFDRNNTALGTLEGDVNVSACHFTDNGTLSQSYSAVHSLGGHLVLNDCVFSNNLGRYGACINGDHYVLEANRCLFAGNRVEVAGGGLFLADHVTATITNCVFAGNRAGEHGGAVAGSAYGWTRITSSIFWDNQAPEGPQLYLEHGALQVQYCDVPGGAPEVYVGQDEGLSTLEWGAGNLDGDPGFADAGHWGRVAFVVGDYHLRSQGGRWNSLTQTWVLDAVTSLCIDAGDPLSPVGAEVPPNGGIINMGIYGGTVEASKSLPPVPSGSGWRH